jgi:hypothetical protein
MSIVDEDLGSLSLVDETAIDKHFDDLVTFDANRVHGDLRFTSEQLDKMNNQMLRRLAQYADTDEINGKSTQLEIRTYFHTQRSLSEYE